MKINVTKIRILFKKKLIFVGVIKNENSTLKNNRSNVELMTSRSSVKLKKRNEKVKSKKLFCSIHKRPTIGDCFPAAAACSALSKGERTILTFFSFPFSIFLFNSLRRQTIVDFIANAAFGHN